MLRSIPAWCFVLAACGENAESFPPGLQDLVLTTAEDTPLTITVPLTATNADAVTLTVVTPPTHGTISGRGPIWSYRPETNYHGDDSVVVSAEDLFGSASATVTIHVTTVDDAPFAVADSFAAAFDTPLTIAQATLTSNDTDLDNTTLTIVSVAAGSHGTPSMSGSSIVFTPEPGFRGTATFVYTVSDGTLTALATVTISVGEDQAPIAADDTAVTNEDVPLVISDSALLGNDTDAEHHTLAVTAVSSVTHGTVSHAGTQVTFTPDANYFGPAGFSYTISDGFRTDVASVAIIVNSVNDVPVAGPDSIATDEDLPTTFLAAGLLGNDSDVEGDTLVVSAVTPTANTHGTLIAVAGVITYIPDLDFNGPADFSYTVSDGNGGSATGTVTIAVAAIDDAPVAVNDSPSVEEDSVANAIDVIVNDTDVDAGPISIITVTQPPRGTVAITGGGTGLTYTPNANYCNHQPPALSLGSPGITASLFDVFTYTLSPGGSIATVAVTVFCVDDPPIAVDDSAVVAEDSGTNFINVLANDIDADGGVDTIASVTPAAHGTTSVGPAGLSVVYTPDPDYCNVIPNEPSDTFTYTLTPGGDTATVSVVVVCACGENKTTDFVVGSN